MTCILYSLVTLTLYKFADIYILRHENMIDKHCLTSILYRVHAFTPRFIQICLSSLYSPIDTAWTNPLSSNESLLINQYNPV